MSQHDYNIADADGASVRADINDALAAIVSHNAGSSAPSTTFSYMEWNDTTNGLKKRRNAANSGWIIEGSLSEIDAGVPASSSGRLTLSSGVPVTTTDVTGATTVYFTPYQGNVISLFNGSTWNPYVFSELSQATTDTTKSPAAVANNSNYDLFVWDDSGTLRCTRGPAWTSGTARGTGAGTTELESLEGRYVNKVAITNGPAAQRGLYVGTIRSDGSAQINDSVAKRYVWNIYNRVSRNMRVVDTTNSWTYTTGSYRQANANAANQLDYVVGLSEDVVKASVYAYASNTGTVNSAAMGVGVGVDSASVNSAQINNTPNVVVADGVTLPNAHYSGFPGVGRHYLAWLEISTASGTTTWSGDAGTTILQTGITGEVMA